MSRIGAATTSPIPTKRGRYEYPTLSPVVRGVVHSGHIVGDVGFVGVRMKISIVLFWLFILFAGAYFAGQWLRAIVAGTLPL